MPNFELTIADYKGRQLDPILEQESQQFLLDDSFFKSMDFH